MHLLSKGRKGGGRIHIQTESVHVKHVPIPFYFFLPKIGVLNITIRKRPFIHLTSRCLPPFERWDFSTTIREDAGLTTGNSVALFLISKEVAD